MVASTGQPAHIIPSPEEGSEDHPFSTFKRVVVGAFNGWTCPGDAGPLDINCPPVKRVDARSQLSQCRFPPLALGEQRQLLVLYRGTPDWDRWRGMGRRSCLRPALFRRAIKCWHQMLTADQPVLGRSKNYYNSRVSGTVGGRRGGGGDWPRSDRSTMTPRI